MVILTKIQSVNFSSQPQEISFVVSQLPNVPYESTTMPNIILVSRLFFIDSNILIDNRVRVENLLCDYSESTFRITSTSSTDNHSIGKLSLCEPTTPLVDTVESATITRI